MRKFVLILFVIPLFLSCSEKNESATSISGIFENLPAGTFLIRGPGGTQDTVYLADDMTFNYALDELTEGGRFFLISDQDYIPLYISPGMKLDVYVDKSNFKESINYAGKGSDINNYLADKNRRTIGNTNLDPKINSKEFVEFKAWADSLYEIEAAFFNEYVKADPADDFWMTEEADILFGWAHKISTYPMYYKYFNDGKEPFLPADYATYKDKLDVSKPEYLKSSAFMAYVSQLVRDETTERSSESEEEVNSHLLNLEVAMELLSNEQVRSQYMLNTITDRMQWNELDDLAEEIEFFKSNCSNEEHLAKFNSELEAWQKLASGELGFDFVGKDADGREIRLSDFKGKYVYVDVWATWCGPCKHEIPFLKELEGDYHDRNIVFLSYSIDDDHEAWLKFVPENELGGVQVIGEAAWESELVKNYRILGVPTFMFFDPEGRIISVKMTRPSSEETRKSFDSYSDL